MDLDRGVIDAKGVCVTSLRANHVSAHVGALQRRILEVARDPHRVPLTPADDAGWFAVVSNGREYRVPPWEANTVTVAEVATAIASSPRRADQRRHHSASSAVSRAIPSLVKRGLLERSSGRHLRITAFGRDAIASALTAEPHPHVVNDAPRSVTCAACGAALGTTRSTKRYCSAACRQAAYRTRDTALRRKAA